MKILHSADWHLDSPIQGHTPEQQQYLKQELLRIPGKIATLCRQEGCDLMLLSGDLFDSNYTKDSYQAVYSALEEVAVPVFITPGNHDHISLQSPWTKERWPANVTVFTEQTLTEKPIPGGRLWGAAFHAMEAPAMLKGFHAPEGEGYAIGILHGDTTQAKSQYCPITSRQIRDSGLDYLALGHIHKGDQLQAGKTLCAWPGCPMGRGYDEPGEKGVLIVELGETVHTRFVPLDTPRFYDLEVEPEEDPAGAVGSLLPAVGSADFYRITLTGPSEPVDLTKLAQEFDRFPNLVLRDRTVRPVDPWCAVGEDSFEGVYFTLLQKNLEGADLQEQKITQLAAKISRQLLDGREVKLP